ncbi:MAG: TIM barrel protein [Chloroflexi bacterium]|nr:TIM barrel protein [Chloroflexota bacterium]
MSKIFQAAAWWCWVPRFLTPEQFVRGVAEIGYAGIDLAPAEFFPLIHAHGLRISAIGGHGSIESGLNRRENHGRIERELRTNIELAARWKIPNLICFAGSRENLSEAEGIARTAEGLRRVAPAAEAAGVTLVLELLNSKVDHPDYQADRTSFAYEVCKAVASPRVKMLYDIYHMQIMEGDVIRTLRATHDEIAHYHTAGNPGRNELDDTQELHYAGIFRAIAATGYAGFVTHEFLPARDPLTGLREAFDIGAKHLSLP